MSQRASSKQLYSRRENAQLNRGQSAAVHSAAHNRASR
jgi:hypothetical protein